MRNLLPNRTGLTREQEGFVRNRASVDLVVYNRVTNRPLPAIEVHEFKYHEDDPEQLERDAIKDEILRDHICRCCGYRPREAENNSRSETPWTTPRPTGPTRRLADGPFAVTSGEVHHPSGPWR